MKFTVAWADVLSENVALKFIIVTLTACVVALSVTSIKLALRDPLVIERSCFVKVAEKGTSERTTREIEAFVTSAITDRFDTNAIGGAENLSLEEQSFRKQEQDKLKLSQMAQKLVVNKVTVEKDSVSIDADRLLTMGEVKAAVHFPLTAIVATTQRTESNPYGLTLVKVSEIKKDVKAKTSP